MKTLTLSLISVGIFICLMSGIWLSGCFSSPRTGSDDEAVLPETPADSASAISDNSSSDAPFPPALPAGAVPGRTVNENGLERVIPSRVLGQFDAARAVHGDIASVPATRLCKTGIVVDATAGRVLWEKGSAQAVPIASMSKMMTALLLLERIASGKDMNLKTPIKVTAYCTRVGGSKAWLDPRETFSAEELLGVMLVRSANDAAELVGETLGGNGPEFAKKMNARAREIGMKSAVFFTPHGMVAGRGSYWRVRDVNAASAYDVAVLTDYLLQYPIVTRYGAMKTLTFGAKRETPNVFKNTNHAIMDACPGCDGLKTGFTNAAGSCVAATVLRNNRRLVIVVTGAENSTSRTKAVCALAEWGFAQL